MNTNDSEQSVTFDGYDGLDLAVKRINIWRDYYNRAKGTVCQVRHGHKGILLGREGDACKVRVDWMGATYEGWVTFYFLKELKAMWQLQRTNLAADIKATVGIAA